MIEHARPLSGVQRHLAKSLENTEIFATTLSQRLLSAIRKMTILDVGQKEKILPEVVLPWRK